MMTQDKIKRTTIHIKGSTYTIVGNEEPEHIRLIAGLVDDKMKEIYEKNRSLDTAQLAVLTALNTMNDYIKLKEDFEILQKLIDEKED